MTARFQPDECLAVIAAYPDLQVAPQMIAWLGAIGVAEIQVHRYGDGRMDCGYNSGVLAALASRYDAFIFADKDIWPGASTAAFLAASADLVSCQYDTGRGAEAWADASAFHTGLWRTRRAVLDAVGPRPFQWTLNDKGTEASECLCRPFARRVAAAGFTIAHAGTAGHTPRIPSALPMRMILTAPPQPSTAQT